LTASKPRPERTLPPAHEVFLDIDDAVDLFHIAGSAITAMAKSL
jgi:hypothetical protein